MLATCERNAVKKMLVILANLLQCVVITQRFEIMPINFQHAFHCYNTIPSFKDRHFSKHDDNLES